MTTVLYVALGFGIAGVTAWIAAFAADQRHEWSIADRMETLSLLCACSCAVLAGVVGLSAVVS